MEALGRLFNVVPVADGETVDLIDAEGVTFIATASDAAETFTITSTDGSTPANVQVDHYYKAEASDGSDTWARVNIPANHVVTPGDTDFVVAIHVPATRLAAGHRWVSCTASASGTVVAITHDLKVQRTPDNLPALVP